MIMIFILKNLYPQIHGKKLKQPFTAHFTPEPEFRFCSVYPTQNDLEPAEVSFIELLFNSTLDESIFNSLSVSPNIPGDWHLVSIIIPMIR